MALPLNRHIYAVWVMDSNHKPVAIFGGLPRFRFFPKRMLPSARLSADPLFAPEDSAVRTAERARESESDNPDSLSVVTGELPASSPLDKLSLLIGCLERVSFTRFTVVCAIQSQ